MGLMDSYLNQSCAWKQRAGASVSGDPTYLTPVAILCRLEDRPERVFADGRESIPSKSSVWLSVAAEVGDILTRDGIDHTITSAVIVPDFGGKEGYRKVRVT